MPNRNQVSFSWRNYFKPTPKNLETLSDLLHGFLLSVSVLSVVQNGPPWLSATIIIIAGLVGVLKKFFAYVVNDTNQVVQINVPPTMEDKVVITQEEITPQPE